MIPPQVIAGGAVLIGKGLKALFGGGASGHSAPAAGYGGGSRFERYARVFARSSRANVKLLNADDCVLQWRARRREYSLSLKQLPDGKVMAMVMTQAEWRGRAPQAAYVLAERMNNQSRCVIWEVNDFRDGTARIIGWLHLAEPEHINTDAFSEISGEMIGYAEEADDLLVQNGYAR